MLEDRQQAPEFQGGERGAAQVLQLFFLQADPREEWDDLFTAQDAWLRDAGLGQVSYAAPFIPTIPGTDRYTDELW